MKFGRSRVATTVKCIRERKYKTELKGRRREYLNVLFLWTRTTRSNAALYLNPGSGNGQSGQSGQSGQRGHGTVNTRAASTCAAPLASRGHHPRSAGTAGGRPAAGRPIGAGSGRVHTCLPSTYFTPISYTLIFTFTFFAMFVSDSMYFSNAIKSHSREWYS